MKKTKFIVLCLFGILVNQAYAQTITNWGTSICNVQLATTLSNNIVASDSVLALDCHVKNSSTNLVYFLGDPRLQFQVYLTSELGKKYALTSDPLTLPGGGGIYLLKPDETNNSTMLIHVVKGLQDGNYQIQTTIIVRAMADTSEGKLVKVSSDPINIKIQ